MKIVIKAIGKLPEPLTNILNNYIKRCNRLKINLQEHKELLSAEEWLMDNPKSYVIALSEYGTMVTSLEFSQLIFNKIAFLSPKTITFLIGGSEGLSKKVLDKSNFVLSFSKLTFPHELFRVFLTEQLYRAESIFLNHPYHK